MIDRPGRNPVLAKLADSAHNKIFRVADKIEIQYRCNMAKKSKDARSYVKLQSTESSHCYFVQKNRNNTKDRLQLRKYDPIVRKHVIYKEGKM
jgi:large subunit ribosomal protein L33